MDINGTVEQTFVSTKLGTRRVRLKPHPQGTGKPPEASTQRRRRRRQLSSPLTVTLSYQGGSEASWVLKDPGHRWRYPGHWALHDVLAHWYSIH